MTTLQQDINRFTKKYINPSERYQGIKYTNEGAFIGGRCMSKNSPPKIIEGNKQKKSI